MKPINELCSYNFNSDSEDNQEYLGIEELDRDSEYVLSDLLDNFGKDAIIYYYDISSCYDQHSEYRAYIKYREIETDEAKKNRLERVKFEKIREAERAKKEKEKKKQDKIKKEKQDYELYLKLKEKYEADANN